MFEKSKLKFKQSRGAHKNIIPSCVWQNMRHDWSISVYQGTDQSHGPYTMVYSYYVFILDFTFLHSSGS